jgi:sigma-B regulation protein RsbU (phosphoserine phosphatase)
MRERSAMGRRMARVAIAAALLILLRLLLGGTALFGDHLLGGLLRLATVLSVAASILYYGVVAWRWSWNHLLWRVRRRLLITYLFVGLTPLLLMTLLGLIAGFGLSAEAMTRLVTVQVDAAAAEAAAAAGAVAEALARLPADADEPALSSWLLQRAEALQPGLPGARLTAWRGLPDDPPALPPWLSALPGWQGLSHLPAGSGEETSFTGAAIRALARGRAHGRPVTVLVEVPLAAPLIRRFAEAAQIDLRPSLREMALEDEHHDFQGLPYAVALGSTAWPTGERSDHFTLAFSWSWGAATRQFLGRSVAGQLWKTGLLVVACVFLGLEALALIAALFITRAVTGTVHDLHRATGFIERGDFSHRVRVRTHDQLGDLAGSFNDMAAHVESLLQERVERERLQKEVEIAARVQAQLFPRSIPRLRTAEIAGECRAARGVAGDYYDYLEVAPGLVTLALGDVSGKGISASLLMSNLQASLRAQATILAELWAAEVLPAGADGPTNGLAGRLSVRAAADRAVARITTSINAQLCRSTEANRFATLFLGLYEDATRTLRYTNAGHNAAILVQTDGSVERLSAGGTVVGAFDGASYEESRAILRPEALLLIFSDGVSEAQNAAGEEYGEERLVQLAVRHRALPADAVRDAVFSEIDRWSGEQDRGDDQTLVVLKGLPASA